MRLCLALLLLCGPLQEGGSVSGKIASPEGAPQKKLRAKVYAGGQMAGQKDPDPSPAVVWLEGAAASKGEARAVEIKQEGLEFRPRIVAIQTGSTVRFPNADDVFHNVFSYSKAQRFDLGKYPKGEFKDVLFEKRGQVDVRCEVHSHMRAYIHVFDHPYYAVAAVDGSYTIPKVPAGKYTLVVWKEFFEPVRQEIEVKADGAKLDVSLSRSEDRPADRTVSAACCDAR